MLLLCQRNYNAWQAGLWIKSVNFPTASIDLIKKLKMGKELIKLPLERLAFRSILLVGNKDI
jgi:hypothetical protein